MQLIVLTPVKNEEWILDAFLSITSNFADLIIIYDDNSQDRSKQICKKFSKVHLIEGKESEYNEIRRQEILINKARELISEDKILLALDADEILTYEGLKSKEWEIIKSANKGTTLFFEKPDLIKDYSKCFRYKDKISLGYIDDGKEHFGKIVHSTRIPVYNNSPKLYFDEIKFMHLALIRFDAYLARQRFYKVVENINHTKSLYNRYKYYNGGVSSIIKTTPELTPEDWYNYWVENKFLPEKFIKKEYYWYDLEIIKYIKGYGAKRFWKDDIWDFDYNGILNNTNLKKTFDHISIKYPPLFITLLIRIIRLLVEIDHMLRKNFLRLNK